LLTEYFGKEIENVYCIQNPYCEIEKIKESLGEDDFEEDAAQLASSFQKTAEELLKMYT